MKTTRGKWPALLAGFFLALTAELGLAWNGADRGYGTENEGSVLEPASIEGYEITDGRWKAETEVPMILFRTEQSPGHIHFAFQEPLEKDTVVVLYYGEDPVPQFDRFSRKERYMMEGTREAVLTIPRGNFRGFRLEIRGDFVPEEIQVFPAAKAGEITARRVLGQVSWLRMVLTGSFVSAGLWLWVQKPKEVSGESFRRHVWLDLVRSLAAVLVIVVHVTEPALPVLPPGTRIHLAARAVSLGALTCNLLFILISGALLLPWRQEKVGVFVRKRLMGMVIPLAVYAWFYVRGMCITRTGAATWVWYYLKMLLGGTIVEAPHFWLVYVMAGLYLLVIPFRYMLKEMPERLEKCLFVTVLALLGIRTASLWFGQPVGFGCFLGDWPGIFLLGYLLTRNWMRRYDGLLAAGGIVAFLAALWIQAFRADSRQIIFNQSIFMACMSMAVFTAALRAERWLAPAGRLLAFCSRYSYSVLLVHWFVLGNFIYNGWMSSRLSGSTQLALPILVCLGLSLGLAVLTDHLWVAVLMHGLNLWFPSTFARRS